MSVIRSGLVAAALLLAGACRTSPADQDRPIYAPHEEGLTLAYENPSLEGSAREGSRLQIRVDAAQPSANGGSVVGEIRHTRLQGEDRYAFEARNGGLKVMDAQKRAATVLPEGFPDRVSSWVEGGVVSRILGRGTSPHFDKLLPREAPKVGVWIESVPLKGDGPRTRMFLLPDVGSAEVLEWKEGRWAASMRLVGRGFTDAPARNLPVPAAPRGAKK